MKRKGTIVRQPRVEGGRFKHGAGLESQVEQFVRREADRFGVSVPFIISVALAEYFGIKIERY